MKKMLLTLLCAATCVACMAQTDIWYWKNNVAVKVEGVDSVTFTPPVETPVVPDTTSATGAENGYGYVDLGLSVCWATANVGAAHPYDYGLYFAWGETTGYTSDTSDGHSFAWANYQWCNGSNYRMTKYCTDSNYGTVDSLNTLEPADDAAAVNMGGNWRMPTKEELDELRDSCTWIWQEADNTEYNGVAGYKVTGANGNSIFLPAAGYRYRTSLSNANAYGFYWSASIYATRSDYAYRLYLDSNSANTDYYDRYRGHPVRAVLPE